MGICAGIEIPSYMQTWFFHLKRARLCCGLTLNCVEAEAIFEHQLRFLFTMNSTGTGQIVTCCPLKTTIGHLPWGNMRKQNMSCITLCMHFA